MRHVLSGPEQRRVRDNPDRYSETGTGPGTCWFRALQTDDPVSGYAESPSPVAVRAVRGGPVGNGAETYGHDPFDPDLPLDALHAAPQDADLPSVPCPDGTWGVDSPVLRARLAEVLTRWTVAAAVCFCAGSDPAPADAAPTRPGHPPGPGGVPDPCPPHSGAWSSLPGQEPGCPASDVIARLRSLIARHLPRTTCPQAGRDGAGTGGRNRVREPGAGFADTAEPGAGVAGTIPAGTGRTRGPGGGPGTEPPDGSRPEPGARTPSGAGPGRQTGCRICLDRVEQAEHRWLSFIRTRWPLCADVGASQAEPSAPARGSRGVAGGGDRC